MIPVLVAAEKNIKNVVYSKLIISAHAVGRLLNKTKIPERLLSDTIPNHLNSNDVSDTDFLRQWIIVGRRTTYE